MVESRVPLELLLLAGRLAAASAAQATMPNFLRKLGIVQARGAGDDRSWRFLCCLRDGL